MFRRVAVLLAVAGCNQLLDLDAPDLVADVDDADGDGVTDSRDNCPGVANPDQLDTDQDRRGDACDVCPSAQPTRDRDNDGIDDACDSCVLGPPVDDDGDLLADACDLCPATPGKDQSDQDGDLIGDDCDDAYVERDNGRVLYDPFTQIDPAWEGGADWQLAPDGSSVSPSLPGLSTLRRDTSLDAVAAASGSFEVAPTGTVGVALADAGLRCELHCTAGQCVLHVDEIGVVFESDPVTVDRGTLKATVNSGFMQFAIFSCSLYRLGQLPTVLRIETDGAIGSHTSIFASPGNKVLGADLIQ